VCMCVCARVWRVCHCRCVRAYVHAHTHSCVCICIYTCINTHAHTLSLLRTHQPTFTHARTHPDIIQPQCARCRTKQLNSFLKCVFPLFTHQLFLSLSLSLSVSLSLSHTVCDRMPSGMSASTSGDILVPSSIICWCSKRVRSRLILF